MSLLFNILYTYQAHTTTTVLSLAPAMIPIYTCHEHTGYNYSLSSTGYGMPFVCQGREGRGGDLQAIKGSGVSACSVTQRIIFLPFQENGSKK